MPSANCCRLRLITGASAVGGSECSQRSIAAWTAAVTAAASVRGNMVRAGLAPILIAIASASAYCVIAWTFRYSPRSAGVLVTSRIPAIHSSSGTRSAVPYSDITAATMASQSGSSAGRSRSAAPIRMARSNPSAQIASYLLAK